MSINTKSKNINIDIDDEWEIIKNKNVHFSDQNQTLQFEIIEGNKLKKIKKSAKSEKYCGGRAIIVFMPAKI